MSLSLLDSIPQSLHFMVGRAVGSAILNGFDQEYERHGGDWQSAHAADAALLNAIGFSAAAECAPPNVC
jgi:hypothetical protein